MEHNRPACSSCSGLNNCTKYCPIRVGENIVNFVNNLDCMETSIGEFREDTAGKPGNKSLVVNGIMVEKGSTPINLMIRIEYSGTAIQSKMIDFLGMTPAQCLKTYTTYCKLNDQVQRKALKDFQRFNSNKIIPTPFKPGADIEVNHIGFDGKPKTVTTNANLTKWMIDKETGRLTGVIIARVGKTEDGSDYVKPKLSEYGINWFLPNIERNLKTSEITREAVRMNDIGLILPLEVSYGDVTLAVDSQHLYLNKNGYDYIIGTWGPNGMVENKEYTSSIDSNKAYKKMKSFMKYIEKHRRFIIPYGLAVPNHIDLK